MNPLRLLPLVIAIALPAAAFAQWQWVDRDGRKVFSDQAPPADVPAKNIVKRPGVKAQTVDPAAAAAAAAPASAPAKPAASAPKLSGKEKELEDKKKLADAAEAEKKKAREDELAKLRDENCARAKSSKAAFDSGVRIARTNAKGEREYMDDAARAVEMKRLEGLMASDCKVAGAQ